MVIADGGGAMIKNGNNASQASFTFPVGNNSGTPAYSPITLNYSGGTYSGNSSVMFTNAKDPNNNSTTDYLSRYWTINQSGYSGYTCNVSANYVNADIHGTETSISSAQYNPSAWIKYSAFGSNTLIANGITNIATVISGITLANPAITVNGGGSYCLNKPASLTTITTGDDPSISYSWSNSLASSSSASPSSAISGTTTYYVTITDGNGISATGSATVTVHSLPVVSYTGTTTVCSGTATTLNGTGALIYTWTGGISNSVSFIPSSSTSYTVTGTDGITCTYIATALVTVNPLPSFTFVKNNVSGCGPLGNISMTSSGGTGVKTYSDNGGSSYSGASLFSNLNVGTYTLKVKDANACLSPVTSTVVSTNQGITFTTTVVNATTCTTANGRVTVLASGGSGFYNYAKDGGAAYQSSNIFTGLLPNTYTIKVKDANSCLSSQTNNKAIVGCPAREEDNSILSPGIFNVYPNPANDHVTLVFTADKEEGYTIRLVDITGRDVVQYQNSSVIGENQYQMNLSEVAKGFYTVILQNGTTLLQSKIVVQ
jgi:hypothetical protein